MLDRHLRYVVTTASTGSFSAAADQIGVTQPAITKGVAAWERQVGFLIFNRGPHGVTLTERGEEFIERASRLLDEAEELVHLGSAARDFMGVVRVGVSPSAIERLLTEPLGKLLSRHPNIIIEVIGSNFERIARQLRAGDVDVAIGFKSAFEDQPDFDVIDLAYPSTTLFARKGHPLLDKQDVTWADITQYSFVAPLDSRPYDNFLRRTYEENGVDPRYKIHRIDCFPLVKRVVWETNSIAFVQIAYTETKEFKERFAPLSLYDNDTSSNFCCATRQRRTLTPAVRAFINSCREHFAG